MTIFDNYTRSEYRDALVQLVYAKNPKVLKKMKKTSEIVKSDIRASPK